MRPLSLVMKLLVAVTLFSLSLARSSAHHAKSLRSAWFKHLHPNGAPNLDAMWLAQAGQPKADADSYTSAGWIAQSIFSDGECGKVGMTMGQAVNTCIIEEGFAYMVRLVQDSCLDGKIEYYFDKKCTKLAGSSSLTIDTSCMPFFGEASVSVTCTSHSEPLIFVESAIVHFYNGDDCDAPGYYLATPTNRCNVARGEDDDDGDDDWDDDGDDYDTMFTCDGGLQQIYYTAGSNCKGKEVDRETAPDICFSGGQRTSQSYLTLRGANDAKTSAASMVATLTRGYAHMLPGATAAARKKVQRVAAKHPAAIKDRAAPAAAVRPTAVDDDDDFGPVTADDWEPVTTDDDVNYDDDDGDDRSYTYDDYVYIYEHDDKDFGYQFNYDDVYGYGGGGGGGGGGIPLDPPPSVSTTPFPTTASEAYPEESIRAYCQAPPPKRAASFTASQTINGVSYNDYKADKAKYEKTLKQAIASAVTGATEDSVTDLVVSSSAAGSDVAVGGGALVHASRLFRMLAGDAIYISYKVTVEDTTWSPSSLAAQLEGAVESGAFNDALQSYAADNGATGLTTATSDSIDTVPEDQDDGDDAPALSTGGIIGVVIGGFAFLVLCAVAVVFLVCRRSGAATNTVKPAPGPVEMTPYNQVPVAPVAVAET